jgi:hypothetical protein
MKKLAAACASVILAGALAIVIGLGGSGSSKPVPTAGSSWANLPTAGSSWADLPVLGSILGRL